MQEYIAPAWHLFFHNVAKDALNKQDVFEDSFHAWQMRYLYYTRLYLVIPGFGVPSIGAEE